MLADFVLKGIDNLFHQKLSLEPQKKLFTKDLIKENLQNVVRRGNQEKSFTKANDVSPNTKSRLRTILEHNKDEKIRSVIKKNKDERSPSPISYTKISSTASLKTLKAQELNNSESVSELKKDQSLISFYREQRKTVEKSRISENSINSRNRSRIFHKHEPINTDEISKEMIQIPSYKRFDNRR